MSRSCYHQKGVAEVLGAAHIVLASKLVQYNASFDYLGRIADMGFTPISVLTADLLVASIGGMLRAET